MKNQQRFWTFILITLILSGCSNNNSPTGNNNDAESISWVDSETVYLPIDGKKEYSIMFFYTDWCQYCQMMEEFTFTNPDVIALLDQSFNSVRINAESDSLVVHFDSTATGIQMKAFYGVTGYPTTCVFKGDGEHITSGVGYTNSADFIAVLNRILAGDFD